jgi:phosphoserine phosphatase
VIEFVVFDMDGTLVNVESSWAAVHDYFGDSNSAGLEAFNEGKIDDHEFLRSDVRVWRKHKPDLTVDDLEAILAKVPLMPGAHELFATLHKRHLVTAIISGGIDLLAKRIGKELGIDYVLANGFEVDADGRLTGDGIVRVPILAKEQVLTRVQEQLGFTPDVTASVGNSEIDVGLFKRSRVGVAFCPEDEACRAGATAVIEELDLAKVGPLLAEP